MTFTYVYSISDAEYNGREIGLEIDIEVSGSMSEIESMIDETEKAIMDFYGKKKKGKATPDIQFSTGIIERMRDKRPRHGVRSLEIDGAGKEFKGFLKDRLRERQQLLRKKRFGPGV